MKKIVHNARKIRRKLGAAKRQFTPRQGNTLHKKLVAILAKQIVAAAQASASKEWAKAELLWAGVVAASPENAPTEAFRQLAISQRSQLKYEQANVTITQAQKKYPGDIVLRAESAEIATAAKDWSEAINQWQQLIHDDNSGKATPKYLTRLIFCQAMSGDHEVALKTATTALKKYPDDRELAMAHAKTLMLQENWKQAVTVWQQIHTSFTDLPVGAWAGLIQSLRMSGNFAGAETAAKDGLAKYNDLQLKLEWAEIPTQQLDWKKASTRWHELYKSFATADWLNDDAAKLHIRFNVSVVDRLLHSESYTQTIIKYSKQDTKRKYVICTSFSAGYDSLKLPGEIDDRFDYVVYTDAKVDGHGVYDVRPFPVVTKDNGRTIRYIKTHPHILFAEYDAAIWIDSSMLITKSLYPLLESFLASGKPIASTPHQHRSTIYEELESCILRKKDDPEIMKKQIAHYTKEGFAGNVLAENGLLMFNLQSPGLGEIMETWWHEIQTYSKRDQLSFGYALFKNNAQWHHIVDKPLHIRNIPEVVLTAHQEDSLILKKLDEMVARNV